VVEEEARPEMDDIMTDVTKLMLATIPNNVAASLFT
jgi:hypothetical protein